ncbi:hypothetical protein ACIGQE_11825 [Streptomyces sp. NPDC053429]|uniref:P-type ATPase n=1 Tax=Streptomyces sp. NPDC053429 TaxID=3365702 RepID=UPI0037CD9FD6
MDAQDPADAGVVILSVMAGTAGLLRFWQEFRSGRAAEAVQALVTTTCAVRRRAGGGSLATTVEVPMDQVVPGDVVKLAAGDLVPADLLRLASKDLMVAQAALTGKSLPVAKADTPARAGDAARRDGSGDPAEAGNLVLTGTSVTSGTATGVVVATGADTYLGSMAGERPPTDFDHPVRRVSLLLIRFMPVMLPVVFVVNGVTRATGGRQAAERDPGPGRDGRPVHRQDRHPHRGPDAYDPDPEDPVHPVRPSPRRPVRWAWSRCRRATSPGSSPCSSRTARSPRP